MADLRIVPAERAHVGLLASSLRLEDARECLAIGSQPFKSVWRSWRGSPQYRKTAFVDGQIAAMWGCGGAWLGYEGVPWLLTAPPVEVIKLQFLRECRAGIAEMLDLYPVLRNYVHNDYEKSIRFLRCLGFIIGDPVPIGKYGALFRTVTLERQLWVQ